LLLSCDYGFAQQQQAQPSQDKPAKSGPVIVDADDVEYLENGAKITAKGNVKIDYDQVVLTSESAEVDTRSKNIIASDNVELSYKGITIHGQRLHYDFDSKQGYIENVQPEDSKIYITYKDVRIDSSKVEFDLEKQIAVAKGSAKMKEKDAVLTGNALEYNFRTETGSLLNARLSEKIWYAGAQKALKTPDKDLIELERAYITTCDIPGKPHYRIQARRVYYYIDDRVVAKNALMFVGNLPVVYFPYWSQSVKDGRSNFSVSVGHKKEWGGFVLTTWRYDLGKYLKYKIHADHRQLKGFASGVDADYDTKDYGFGQLKTYYMNERDKYEDNPQEKERYRGQLKHRWQIDDTTLGLFEYNKLSDIDFTKDYLYREYADDVQPVSETSLTHYEQDFSISLYARKRTNRFYSEVERLPEVELNTVGKEIADTNFYLRHDLALANLNKKNANSGDDTDANRVDSYNELKYPTKLPGKFDWINIAPYIGTRQTYYSKDNNGTEHGFVRGIHYYGFEMNTKFFRIFDCKRKALGIEINRLRHIITPNVKYSYIHSPTVEASRLGTFDDIDSITSSNVFNLGVENHLQTKWAKPGSEEMENVDILYFYPYVEYRQNAAPGTKHFGFINTEFNLKPYRWLHFDSDSVFNQYQRRMENINFDLYAIHDDKWSFGLGKRYDRDISEQLTTDLYYKFNQKWQARVYTRYLSYTDSFQQQQYTVYRDLHCWLLEATYDIKLNDDGSVEDRTFWFIFRLKAFPDETPIRFNIGYETTNRI
jgi:lipopolysaccharide assembly outer membrane protein LptD (OstA)